jgi:hypothetical protein
MVFSSLNVLSDWTPTRLDPLGEIFSNPNWKHEDPFTFVSDYLKKVVEYVTNVLYSTEGILRVQQDIKYVLTVPAAWSDNARNLLRKAAASVDIRGPHLVTEPEAAALYCLKSRREADLNVGDCFLMCDAGGATVVTNYLFLFN